MQLTCSDASVLPHEILQDILRMVLSDDRSMETGVKCCLMASGWTARLDGDILDVLIRIATERIAAPADETKHSDGMRHLLLLLLVRSHPTHERYIFDVHFLRVLNWLERRDDKAAALHALWRHANPNGHPRRPDCVLLDLAEHCVMSRGCEEDVDRLRRMYATGRVSPERSLQAIMCAFDCAGRSGSVGRRRLVETVLECDCRWDDEQYVTDNAHDIVLRLSMPCREHGHGFTCVHHACMGYGSYQDAYGCLMVVLLKRAVGRMIWSVADAKGRRPADLLDAAFLREVVSSAAD